MPDLTVGQIKSKRMLYLALSTLTLLFLGLIYAFSMFAAPICTTFGLEKAAVGLTFNIMMITFCVGAVIGSQIEAKIGVRNTLFVAAALFFCGFAGTGLFGNGSITVVYLCYGVLGGLGLVTQLPPEVCFYTLLAAFAALIWRNRTLMDAQRKLDGLELPDPPQSQDWSGQAQAHADYLARQERLELELRHASQRVDDLAAQGGRAFDTLEYLTPPARSRVDTAARLARVEAEIAQRRQVLAQSQGRLEQLGNPEEAQARASQLEGHRLVRLEEYDALELAMKVLSDANDELRQRFSPALNQEAARILSALTGGRYQHLTLSRDFSAQAGPGNALPRSALYLSAGTLDQLYLALRLAICQLTLPGIPLVLDDALANFDDQRLDLALTFLEQLGQQRQVLLFSCQHREESWACAHQIPALTLGGGSQH